MIYLTVNQFDNLRNRELIADSKDFFYQVN
jgi:hypothetical protein